MLSEENLERIEAAEVAALDPDVVIIATGGLPSTELFEGAGQRNVVISRDIISGDVKPAENMLIHDESGDHPALQAAKIAAEAGSSVEIMTPDRVFAPDIMAMNLVPYMRSLQDKDVTFTVTRRLLGVAREGNNLTATIGTDNNDNTHAVISDALKPRRNLFAMLHLFSVWRGGD